MSSQRHTTQIIILRWIFPVLGLLVLIMAVAWPAIRQHQAESLSRKSATGLRIEGISMKLPQGGKPAQLTVSNPEFSGRDEQGRPYVITALRVIQDGLQPGSSLMNLEKPTARLILDGITKDQVTLIGNIGLYEPKLQTLQLEGDVKLIHSNGYTMDMQDLFVDLQKGISHSRNPVSGEGPAGHLAGETLELRDKGKHIILHGRSKLVLTPQKDG